MTIADTYKPRRASLERWLKDAPDYVLDVFYHPRFADCYTVLLCGSEIYKADQYAPHSRTNTIIPYLSMSANPAHPQGVSMYGEFKAWQAIDYRYHNARRHRVSWLSLPQNVRDHVRARVEEDANVS